MNPCTCTLYIACAKCIIHVYNNECRCVRLCVCACERAHRSSVGGHRLASYPGSSEFF